MTAIAIICVKQCSIRIMTTISNLKTGMMILVD